MTLLSTIVISLKRAQSRRVKFLSFLKENKLNWEILDAIDGLELTSTPPEYNEDKVIRLLGYPLSASEVACFLSHRLAWARCIEINRITLVLEDDFEFLPHFYDAINAAMTIYEDWDIVRLQGLHDSPAKTLVDHRSLQFVQNLTDPLGATAYLLKPKSAKKLLQVSQYIYEPLDHFLEHHKKHGLRIIAIKPYPVQSSGSTSTILDRPERKTIHGIKKLYRSLFRAWDRIINPNPWFP